MSQRVSKEFESNECPVTFMIVIPRNANSPKVVEESEGMWVRFGAVLKVLASLLTTVDDASPIHGRDRWVKFTQGPVDLLQDLARLYLPRSRRGIPPSASIPSEEGERNEASGEKQQGQERWLAMLLAL